MLRIVGGESEYIKTSNSNINVRLSPPPPLFPPSFRTRDDPHPEARAAPPTAAATVAIGEYRARALLSTLWPSQPVIATTPHETTVITPLVLMEKNGGLLPRACRRGIDTTSIAAVGYHPAPAVALPGWAARGVAGGAGLGGIAPPPLRSRGTCARRTRRATRCSGLHPTCREGS